LQRLIGFRTVGATALRHVGTATATLPAERCNRGFD
jgi:hypothetical protein